MRGFFEVKETELTKAFNELERQLYEARNSADWIETLSQVAEPKVSFEQIMECDDKKIVFSMELDLENEKEVRRRITRKAEELKKEIEKYQKLLVKKLSLALDETKGQGHTPNLSEE